MRCGVVVRSEASEVNSLVVGGGAPQHNPPLPPNSVVCKGGEILGWRWWWGEIPYTSALPPPAVTNDVTLANTPGGPAWPVSSYL